MRTPHKHAAVIKAYADGALIQWRNKSKPTWADIAEPCFAVTFEYRVKPSQSTDEQTADHGEVCEMSA